MTLFYTGILLKYLQDYWAEPILHGFITQFGARQILTTCAEGYEIALQMRNLAPTTFNNEYGSEAVSKKSSDLTAARFTMFAGAIIDAAPGVIDQCFSSGLITSGTWRCFLKQSLTVDDMSQQAADYWRLRGMIIFLNKSDKCHQLGCLKTTADTLRAMRACTGCRCIHYCSRSCQKRAWTHPGLAHRDLCTAMATICNRLRLLGKLEHLYTSSELAGPRPKVLQGQEVLLRYVIEKLYVIEAAR